MVPSRLFRFVFLAFVAATGAFGREFAHLHVTLAGVPLFSGELALSVLTVLGAGCLWAFRWRPARVDAVAVAVAAFVLVGAGHAAAGLARGFGLAALRDFAIAYYAVLFFVTLAYRILGGSLAAFAAALAAGCTLGGAVAIARLLVAPRLEWGHGVPGHQALVAWSAVLAALLLPSPRSLAARAARALVVAVGATVVLLSAYRTMLVVLAGVALASGAAYALRRHGPARRVLAASAGGVLVWGAIVAAVAFSPRPAGWPLESNGAMPLGRALYLIATRWAVVEPGAARPAAWEERGAEETGATPVDRGSSSQAPPASAVPPRVRTVPPKVTVVPLPGSRSVGFRLLAWKNAVERIRSSPLVGIGFGPEPKLHPDRHCQLLNLPTSNCGNAHNTYLTVAMRMGLPVLIGFLLLNGVVVVRSLRALRRAADPTSAARLAFLLATLASFALYAATSLFLESPYLSSLYWIVLALTYQEAREAAASCAPESPAPVPPPAT